MSNPEHIPSNPAGFNLTSTETCKCGDKAEVWTVYVGAGAGRNWCHKCKLSLGPMTEKDWDNF